MPFDNKAVHIEAIDTSITELFSLQARTKAPAIIQSQLIGTIVDNTICLLTAPGNALDKGKRYLSFENYENWLSAMQAVHRSFYSSIHLVIEKGLDEFCKERMTTVESSIKKKFDEEYGKIKDKLNVESEPLVGKLFQKMSKSLRPGFYDYLNTALDISCMGQDQKIIWRKFFDALTILRNKSSHSDPTLTEGEVQRLKEGGYGALVSPTNELQVNARNYYQIAVHALDFFDELTK